MKIIKNFESFLENTVNLNKNRYETAIAGIDTITDFLKSDEILKEYFINTSPQGSIKQKTIIKPASEEHEFDVDLLFEMTIAPDWEPKDYLKNVADQFRASDRYKDLVDTKGKSRCVTIDYENDFHIDIVPAIKIAQGYLIMNKNSNEFEVSDGDGYAQWFENQTVVTNGFLVESVRLMKYIRDINEKYLAKSILLTTLLGNQITTDDIMDNFPDLPTTFKIIINRLDVYLQAHSEMPIIENPVLPEESFNRHWDQDKYEIFRDEIHDLVVTINDAYDEAGEDQSIKKWQVVFGDKFPSSIESDNANGRELIRDINEQFLQDLGISTQIQYDAKINARITQDGFRPFFLFSSLNPLAKLRAINFVVQQCNVPEPYEIKWKVKNYGLEAARAGDLRGEISNDRGNGEKLEHTKYAGEHYVECYIIRDGVCVAQDKITVPIGSF